MLKEIVKATPKRKKRIIFKKRNVATISFRRYIYSMMSRRLSSIINTNYHRSGGPFRNGRLTPRVEFRLAMKGENTYSVKSRGSSGTTKGRIQMP